MARISLTRNLNGVVSSEEFQFQVAEMIAHLENFLNGRVDLHLVESSKKSRVPTLKYGDLVIDLTKETGVATLQFFDGTKLISIGFESIAGKIDLIARGIGSGDDRNKILASDGQGNWELRIPEQIQFNAIEDIPAFSLATADGQVADSSDITHFNRVIGMVIEDVANGFIGEATVDGTVTNPAWAWSPGSKLFLNGTTISLTPPAVGFSQMVAVARNAQIIIMKLGEAVLL